MTTFLETDAVVARFRCIIIIIIIIINYYNYYNYYFIIIIIIIVVKGKEKTIQMKLNPFRQIQSPAHFRRLLPQGSRSVSYT